MSLMKNALRAIAVIGLCGMTSIAIAAPPVPQTPSAQAQHVVRGGPAGAQAPAPQGNPQQQDTDQQKQGPQPGKPLPFLGNTFFIFGNNALKLGSVDTKERKELGSLVINPPWNDKGISLCGSNYVTDAKDKTTPACVNVNADGVLNAPSIGTNQLTLAEYNFADLPKDAKSTDVYLCKDCYVLRPKFHQGFFGVSKDADEKIVNIAVRKVGKDWYTLNGELVHYGQ